MSYQSIETKTHQDIIASLRPLENEVTMIMLQLHIIKKKKPLGNKILVSWEQDFHNGRTWHKILDSQIVESGIFVDHSGVHPFLQK